MPLETLTPELARQIAADYPSLQSLNLSNNALRDVCHLQLLPCSLTQLDLGANRLATLPLELGTWLPELRLLRVRSNALESLRPLTGCLQLQTLDAGDNRVALVSELRFLESLGQLRQLLLDGNPVAEAATYRREVLAMLPQLQSLDGQEVTAAERLYAKLQLKTQLGGGAMLSKDLSPSPTRLLTPESLRTQINSEQEVLMAPLTTTLRVEVNGTEEHEERRGGDDRDFRVDRVNFQRFDEEERRPMAEPTPTLPTLERSAMFRPTRGSNRRNECICGKQSDSYAMRDTQHGIISRFQEDHTTTASGPETRETLLKNRVEALEGILAVQDKTMRHTLARFGERHPNPQLSVAASNDSGAVPTVEAAAAVYTQLMAAWREKCVALMVQTRSSELAHETLIQEYRQQEAQTNDELARCEERIELWQQHAADFEAQRDLEVVATRQAEDRRVQANSKAVQAVRGLTLEREKLQHLAKTVVQFTGGLVRGKMEQLHSGSARLEALERRLSLAKERIELAGTLIAHREARLRNSEAAVEAERRVWAHRLEQMRNLTLQKQNSKNENDGGSDNVVAPSTADAKILRPATETALRALFHKLDSYDAGLVRSQVLLQALRRGDPGVLSVVGGPKKLSKLVTHVEAAIRKLSLAGRASATLTWGEFLLFFIPESSVSLSALLQDNDADRTDGADVTPEKPNSACVLCTAVKSNGLPSWPFTTSGSTGEPTEQEGEALSNKRRKERRALQTLTHADLVQQNAVLLADRERLRRLVARDAHDLRDRVRGVRREWEVKTGELAHQKDLLQCKLDEQTEELHHTQKQQEAAEAARDEALLEVQRLREQLSAQTQEFEQHKKKLDAEGVERLQHEQEIWQTEVQDVRLAHSLLQADHSKQQVRIRQLERDLSRQKEALLAHETERVASLEEKVHRRDTELARLRRERNTILSSLREQERKLAEASAPAEATPTETISTQTEETPPLKQRAVASQTTPAAGGAKYERGEGRMSINEISAPNSLDGDHEVDSSINHRGVKPPRPISAASTRLSPEDVNLRLQKLQSLTESLLAD
ncbi:hypothetical protein KRP22_013807 [Phytophthora ramorum]|nr:Dynein axonemal assembly factor 11 [Phytophthora ramorum]